MLIAAMASIASAPAIPVGANLLFKAFRMFSS
jgi:hypothetical protein